MTRSLLLLPVLGLSLLACGLTAGLALPFYGVLDLSNIVMLFLLTVVLVAVKAGGGPAVMASLVSVVLFDFLFVPPRFSLAVSHAQYLVTFAVMLAVSLLVGHLTAGLRTQATAAAGRERIAQALYGLARALAGAMSVEQVAEAVAGFLRDNWGAECVLLLAGDGDRLIPAPGTATHLEPPELVMARTACEAGRGLVFAEGEIPERHFLPMIGATRNRGALVVRIFLGRGAMKHDHGAPVPGEPAIPTDGDLDLAWERLLAAIAAWKAQQSAPQPHFFFGSLTRAQYERLHAMHIADHLSAVTPNGA